MNMTLKIGDHVWVYDENYRVYPRDERGHATGSPIWREHWVKRKVIGENRASFFIGRGEPSEFSPTLMHVYTRVIKADLRKNGLPRNMCLSEKELDQLGWVHDNIHVLCDRLHRTSDFNLVAQVARLIAPDLAPPEGL